MIRILDVLVAVIAARMAGDQLVVMIEADPVGIGFQRQLSAGILGRHRVAVGIERHAELARCPDLGDGGDVEAVMGQRVEIGPLIFETHNRLLAGLAVDAHVGHRVEPVPGCRMNRGKIGDIQSGQQVLFDIADTVFHTPFFVALAHIAGRDGKTVMSGKVQVFGVEHRRRSHNALEHGTFKIVDHDSLGNPAEELKGVLMTSQKMLHGLGDGKLDIHQPAVAKDHDEEAQPSAGRADIHGTQKSPSRPARTPPEQRTR